jgi:hypothetical protein
MRVERKAGRGWRLEVPYMIPKSFSKREEVVAAR